MTTDTHSLGRRLGVIDGLKVDAGAPLARHSTLRIGGPAELWVEASSQAALSALLESVHSGGVPLMLMGQGSNVLFPDEGLRGVVCRLAGEFREVVIDENRVEAGGAVLLALLAKQTVRRGLAGLEALAGFPSTVGGAVVMNAGCYGTEIKDVLIEARGLDAEGREVRRSVAELDAGYRRTALQGSGVVVTKAIFELADGDPVALEARMLELNQRRRESLPSGRPSCGSIFRNPPEDYAGRLIEACRLKGMRRGGAKISDRHANVILNEGDARAEDVIGLMVEARRRVLEEHGVELVPELVLAGSLGERWREG